MLYILKYTITEELERLSDLPVQRSSTGVQMISQFSLEFRKTKVIKTANCSEG